VEILYEDFFLTFVDYQIGRNEGNTPTGDPTQYRGLDFGIWLDIFLQYAICLTKYEDPQVAYNVCKSAKDANVFYHDRMHPNRDKRPTFLISAVHLGELYDLTDCTY